SAGRAREVAVRLAVGAARVRVVRQLLTESVLVALFGGALGLLLAWWGVDLLKQGFPAEIRKDIVGWDVIALDRCAFAFTFAIAVACGVVAGLAPALHVSPAHLNDALRDGGRAASPGRSRRRWRGLLVGCEVALAVVLLIGATLMLRGFRSLMERSEAREPDTLLTLRLALTKTKYPEPWKVAAFYRDVVVRLEQIPGMKSAAAASALPHTKHSKGRALVIEGRMLEKGERPSANYQAVTPHFFETLRVPILQGRAIMESDGSQAP